MSREVRVWRDSSGRLVCSCDGFEAAAYSAVCEAISRRFCLAPEGDSIDGFDVMFQDYACGNRSVGLEWDIWMGFMAVAKSEDSEPLIQAIAAWLAANQADSSKGST